MNQNWNPFKTSRKLLTVYDYESEAVEGMIHNSEKRGAKVMSADFSWPRLRIQSSKLKMMLVGKSSKKKKRGLFVFPLHSRITGARYPYLWMSIAQENGWHVLVDACALGPKDMDSFGLSLFQPDFLICSFYKIFGENPSGFGCLFVKKSAISVLESSISTGIVNILPAKEPLELGGESSGTDTELEQTSKFGLETSPSSFSGSLSQTMEQGDSSEISNALVTTRVGKLQASEIGKSGEFSDSRQEEERAQRYRNGNLVVECRALDQVNLLGLILIANRSRYLINWLVSSLMKLEHPVLVQKLADRSSISLSYGFLHHICFSDKYADEKTRVLERRESAAKQTTGNILKDKSDGGITVVTAALGFLSNFEDAYRLWAFVARFLDADFVEKERWRYTGLNQKTIEV